MKQILIVIAIMVSALIVGNLYDSSIPDTEFISDTLEIHMNDSVWIVRYVCSIDEERDFITAATLAVEKGYDLESYLRSYSKERFVNIINVKRNDLSYQENN